MSEPKTTPQPGQVWRQTKRGGMWRTIVAIHPAGVEWTAGPMVQPKAPVVPHPADQAFSRWETWHQWVEETGAQPA
jgi:hypothetical protein